MRKLTLQLDFLYIQQRASDQLCQGCVTVYTKSPLGSEEKRPLLHLCKASLELWMTRKESKEYFREAVRKSRKKQRLEIESLRKRNLFLVDVELPELKRKCGQLVQECSKIIKTRECKKLIGPVTVEMNESTEALKSQVGFLRRCERQLTGLLNSSEQRMNLKNNYFYTKQNYIRLKTLAKNVFCGSYSSLRESNFPSATHERYSMTVRSNQQKTMTIAEFSDIPISQKNLISIFNSVCKNPFAFAHLLSKWKPGELQKYAHFHREVMLQGESYTLEKVNYDKENLVTHKVIGKEMLEVHGKDVFLACFGMVSDFKEDCDGLTETPKNDPQNVCAYVIEEGKDENHSKMSLVTELVSAIDQQKLNAATQILAEFNTSLDYEFMELFLKSCFENENWHTS